MDSQVRSFNTLVGERTAQANEWTNDPLNRGLIPVSRIRSGERPIEVRAAGKIVGIIDDIVSLIRVDRGGITSQPHIKRHIRKTR